MAAIATLANQQNIDDDDIYLGRFLAVRCVNRLTNERLTVCGIDKTMRVLKQYEIDFLQANKNENEIIHSTDLLMRM